MTYPTDGDLGHCIGATNQLDEHFSHTYGRPSSERATIPVVLQLSPVPTDVPLRVQDAIALARGFTAEADPANVTLTRGGEVHHLDLLALYERGESDQNWALKDGDVVHVGDRSQNKVFVLGEARKPASLPMVKRGMTLTDALGSSEIHGGGGPGERDSHARRRGARRGLRLHLQPRTPELRADTDPAGRAGDLADVGHRSPPLSSSMDRTARAMLVMVVIAATCNGARTSSTPTPSMASFPGAQGGGALSKGGRGGTVYPVTNLNDSGAGSLRACVEANRPRTCVFQTGGTIELLSSLKIANPFITIAGQTAPGGGIQITGPSSLEGHTLYITTHDVVVQFLRIRRGWYEGEVCATTCATNVLILSNHASHDPYNIILDHVSLEWSGYESIIGLGSNTVPNLPRSLTVSWSLLGEALAGAGQTTNSEFGGYSGQGPKAPDAMIDLDLHHNLLTGATHRFPLMTNKSARLVNNIIYGWTFYATRHKGLRDIINNYFKLRIAQTISSHEISAWIKDERNDTSLAPSFYVTGNIGPNDPSGTDNWTKMTALAVNQSLEEDCLSSPCPLSTTYRRSSVIPTPAQYIPITPDPVSTISSPSGPMLNTGRAAPYDGVGASRKLDCAGRWADARDSVDSRIVKAVAEGKNLYGSFDYANLKPRSQADLGSWPVLDRGTPCVDQNNNGLPDTWESYWAKVFAKRSTLNPNGREFGDPYTNLEHYINGMNPIP